MPFLWGSGCEPDSLYESLQHDPTVEDVTVMSRFDDEYLFEIDWTPRVALLFEALLSHEGSALLNAYTSGSDWCFRLLYPDEACLESVEDECKELGLDMDVERVYSLSEAFTREHFQLTEKQYDTIVAAYEAGYYDIPREVNLKQLADSIGVSHQALSERLRRGHEELMANSLGMGFEDSITIEPGSERTLNEPPLTQPDNQ